MTTVSVIIPVYNGEDYIAEAVSSALDQKDVQVEVLVVDDGSTDATWERLQPFSSRIRILKQANAGPARARNHGASLATGEWLAFLDADDYWHPEKLVRQIEVADVDTALVYSDRLNVGDCEHVSSRQSDGVHLHEGEIFEPLLLDNFITLSSVIVRKQVFDLLEGFEESLAGTADWDLWLRVASKHRVQLCREPLTFRRWHIDAMSNKHDHMHQQRLLVIERALATPRARALSPIRSLQAHARVWETSAWMMAPTQRWRALGWYARASCFWPFRLAPYKGMSKCLLGRV